MAAKSPKKRNAMGRGLGALLEDSSTNVATTIDNHPTGSINEIELSQIPFEVS